MMTMTKTSVLMLMLIGVSAIAEPIVIRDYGGHSSGVPDKEQIAKSVMNTPITSANKNEMALTLFPLTSTLRPGVLNKPQKLKNKILDKNAFFIVGNDERSRNWIHDNKAYLTKINAKGLVTNMASESEFKSLVAFAEPLSLEAIPVDELAESLDLSVYPVLITNEEIAQ